MAATFLPLRDGTTIPIFGLGVYQSQLNGETKQACIWALNNGYRMIDTAAIYRVKTHITVTLLKGFRNEEEVGQALKESGLTRDQVYISTKLWNTDHGKDKTIASFQDSLKKLGVEYVDLYLMHSPKGGATVETWKAMVDLKKKGLAKSIGVSNFNVHHLEALIQAVPEEIPSVNQVELSPYLTRSKLVEFCRSKGIAIQAYSPLTRGKKLSDPKLVAVAEKYGKSTAQILIKWSLQNGYICIPKSVKEERIIQNSNVFDFQISDEDMAVMNGWNEDFVTVWTVIDDPWIP